MVLNHRLLRVECQEFKDLRILGMLETVHPRIIKPKSVYN